MKVKALVLAISAVSAGAANAYTDDATNLYLTGASAIRVNVAKAVQKLCADAGGSFTLYKNGSSTSSLANQQAYVCSAGLAGTGITTVFHTTTGGSLNSILGMSKVATRQQQPMNFTGCTAAVAGTAALADFPVVRANCGLDAAAKSDGGLSDVEYAPVIEQVEALNVTADGFDLSGVQQGYTGLGQAFGIGVSDSLYKALQTAQGLNTCGAGLGDPTPACQPTVSRSDIVSLINGLDTPAVKNGKPFGLTGNIEYARRVSTSGTQSSAQVHFLGLGCLNGPNFGQFDIVGGNTEATGTFPLTANYSYSVNSGTSNVLTRLGNTGWVFGVVSAENVGTGTATTAGWRFVKIDGQHIADGAKQKANAMNGKYQFFTEPVTYKTDGIATDTDESALIDAIAAKMALTPADDGVDTTGIFILPENPNGYDYNVPANAAYVGKYQRGGSTPNSCQQPANPF